MEKFNLNEIFKKSEFLSSFKNNIYVNYEIAQIILISIYTFENNLKLNLPFTLIQEFYGIEHKIKSVFIEEDDEEGIITYFIDENNKKERMENFSLLAIIQIVSSLLSKYKGKEFDKLVRFIIENIKLKYE